MQMETFLKARTFVSELRDFSYQSKNILSDIKSICEHFVTEETLKEICRLVKIDIDAAVSKKQEELDQL